MKDSTQSLLRQAKANRQATKRQPEVATGRKVQAAALRRCRNKHPHGLRDYSRIRALGY